VTGTPARASFAPKNPPTPPAPTTRTRVALTAPHATTAAVIPSVAA
jgi:hypothetical protein